MQYTKEERKKEVERCKILYPLSIRGEGGEKENAKKQLEKRIKKYGIIKSEYDGTINNDIYFNIHFDFENKTTVEPEVFYNPEIVENVILLLLFIALLNLRKK